MNPADRVPSLHPRLNGGPTWVLSHLVRADSTQTLARGLSAWSAVWADEQTGGRGQAERVFVSDAGGLYITAVLPFSGDALTSRGFALAVGWALCVALRRIGVIDVRLRWPNDLMVGMAKVGGILVEQGSARTLLVGVGLNITNQPWLSDQALQGVAGRLADYVDAVILTNRAQLAETVLRAIGLAHRLFARRRLEGMVPLLDRCWGEPREVVLEPAGGVVLSANGGVFIGIDMLGAVRLLLGPKVEERVPAHYIHRMRELR